MVLYRKIHVLIGTGDTMNGFLIAIMIVAGLMIIAYFAAAITKKSKLRILFSALMLLLIALLIAAYIYSIVTHQHAIVLLILAIVFIGLHRAA